MAKLRILLLVNRWYVDGGVENFLEQLIDETSWQVDYVIASLTTAVDSVAKCEKIGPVLRSQRVQEMFTRTSAIESVMCDCGFDVVHIQASNGSAFFLARLAEKAGISRRIIHSHNAGAEILGNPIKRMIGEFSSFIWAKAPTDLWACSTNAGEYLFGSKPFTVLFNGIDIEKFRFSIEKRARIRAELGIEEGVFLLGSIGRISLQKDPVFQLQVFSKLRKLIPSARFCMVGSGDMEAERTAEAKRLGLGDSLIVVPRTSESDAFYSAFDALLLASAFEGLSFVGIEGQAAGLPFYGSDVLPRELEVTDRITFAPVEDGPESWACRIADGISRFPISARPGYAETMRDAGFDREGCFAKIADAYGGGCR